MKMNNNFSSNLARIRKQHNLTQQQAAELIGISRGSLATYEENRAEPSISTFFSMCRVFNIMDPALFYSSDNYFEEIHKKNSSQHFCIIESKYNSLLPKDKRIVNILLDIDSK